MKSPAIKEITEILLFTRAELTGELLDEIHRDQDCIVIKDGLPCLQRAATEESFEKDKGQGRQIRVIRTWIWSKEGWPGEHYEDRTGQRSGST